MAETKTLEVRKRHQELKLQIEALPAPPDRRIKGKDTTLPINQGKTFNGGWIELA